MLFSHHLTPRSAVGVAVCGWILCTKQSLANPAERRADHPTSSSVTVTSGSAAATGSTDSLSASISLSSGSPNSTVIHFTTTTSDGPAANESRFSKSSPASSSASTSANPSQTGASPARNGTAECQFENGPFSPFCTPANGSDAWVGEDYEVTWDPRHFPSNSSVIIKLNYVDSPGGGGDLQPWESEKVANAWGTVTVTMKDDWRQSLPRNNLTFSIFNLASAGANAATKMDGPTISLIEKPTKPHAARPTTSPSISSNPALEFGLGIFLALAAILLIVCGLFYGMRRRRNIGLGNVMGRPKKGYGEHGSRRRRMKKAAASGKGGAGYIRLGDEDLISPRTKDFFTDDPNSGIELSGQGGGDLDHTIYSRGESLDSLLDSPTGRPFDGRENPFR